MAKGDAVRVVAIGASAGGIEAFRAFFESMPGDTGMAFVVVLHLAVDRKSLLAEIISRWTSMTVSEAQDAGRLEPNQVYVIPPGFAATMRQGRLHLRPFLPDAPRETTPIDGFFDSLASDMGESAVGIVLSGTGHDGALGLKAIKARGGLTLAQGTDGTAPQHEGMPHSAIATGAVDVIVPVQDMPRVLMAARADGDANAASLQAAQVDTFRRAICDILQSRLGHDFSQYKDKTFLRRVERRMQVLNLPRLSDYVSRLERDRDETVLLFRDLLIGVTTFFRDAGAFEAVEQSVVPRLFAGKGGKDRVRIWVPGCATGEEAYSLAILVREHMDRLNDPPTVQIFATDIDEPAIGTARSGRYPATLLDGLSPERRQRFFRQSENSFLVSPEIRNLCTFSAHSLIRDPPFSRMNLVSCRNLLIYMDADLQASVIPAFHYSLLPGGILLLGSAETVVRHEELFAALGKDQRIFQRRDVPSPPMSVVARTMSNGHATRRQSPEASLEGRTDWARSLAVANTRVLERFASPFVVVTEDGTVVHYSSHVGGMLQPALGPPSRSVFELARRGLRHALRAALRAAVETGRPVEHLVPLIELDDGSAETMTLVVEPLPGQEPDRPYLIVFKNIASRSDLVPTESGDAGQGLASELERELRDYKEQLQSLNEEHETALEELRSSNEELHSVNEELQSSNEELETSKEEIQSINEELQTVNAQLSTKVDELDRANSDLLNLFESTRVATVFLDQHMIIRAFTPEVGSIYNLIPSDRGRPLTDIVGRLDYATLREDVQHVLRTLEPLERRVSRQDGTAHYLLRILPYRTPDSAVDGSLVTFVDVTQIIQAEQHQRLLIDELNHRVKNMLTVVISLATQTLKRASSLEAFSTVFLGRVHALTAAYSLLSRENWSSVQLAEVAAEELRPFMAADRANIRIQGPAVPLGSRGALAFGMAIHELATNAAKYGSLSVTEGDVSVTWTIEEETGDGVLVLDWVEQNGPPVTAPSKRGFGSILIERGLTHDLSGEARIEFLTSGVRARIRAPLAKFADNSPPQGR